MPALAHPPVDAVSDSLRQFNSAEQWHVRTGVPIFKPHSRPMVRPDGHKYTITVTATDLEAIAAKARRLDAAGLPICVLDGHRDQSKPETEQPPVLGYARNIRVGRFGPQQELGLLADLQFYRDTVDRLRNLPFRSAEYYPPTGELRGVAMLTRDAFLDMGAVLYANGMVPYAQEFPDMPDPAFDPKQPAAAEQKPAGIPPVDPDALDPEHEKTAERYMKYYRSKGYVKYEEPKPAEAAPPDGGGAKPDEQAAAYQREIARLQAENNRWECRTLVGEVAAHYSLDVDHETAVLAALPANLRSKHLDKIKQHHTRKPVGGMIPLAGDDRPPADEPVDYAEVNAICSYATANNIADFAQAKAGFRALKK